MLIADDVEINRVILAQFFQDEYQIVEAANGAEAWDIITSQKVNIVLADLVMPVMDGYELLTRIKRHDSYASIPVLVMTARTDADSEVRAMELGASDFVTKPYNPTVVRCRVRNVMARLENEWRRVEQIAKDRQFCELRRHVELDSLTEIYNRETFYRKAAERMQAAKHRKFVIVYLDISCFKVINDLFRMETGNLVLKTAAYYFKAMVGQEGIAGRMEADHFALCMPKDRLQIEQLLKGLDSTMKSLGISHHVLFYAGIYPVENTYLPVDQMCDRAHMALNQIKGNYMHRYAVYDESMREVMLEEQMIVRDMEFALQERQFCIFLQPIYDQQTCKIVGAEALVRWNHPKKGMISPASFIPVFERNGFIVRLDRFVWEEVCRLLRQRIQSGGSVTPVSVNVSRLNFYNENLLNYLQELVRKYGLQPELLRLEITETAYTENPRQLIEMVRKFREAGFQVLMDDFGSGYSSLNMLKNLPVDILKIDMAFANEVDTSGRARVIMKAIVNMAQDLGMGIVTEGVETKPQLDYLAGIGCRNIQGYYFSRPIPVPEFVALCDREGA